MKNIFLKIVLMILPVTFYGQNITSSVISSSGDYYTSGNYSLSITVGEPVTDNYTSELYKINTGFQQGTGNRMLNLKFYLEGLFNGTDMNQAFDDAGPVFPMGIADKFQLTIAKSTTPYALLYTDTNALLNINGNSVISLPAYLTGNNYIVLYHRNHLETWSSSPISFANDTITYNFTSAASKAYGDNQKEVAPGIFAILVGDVNQDGVVDISDLVAMDADLTNGTLGYIVYDLNGDGVIDISDLVKIDENLTNGVVVITP
jgi:hypothetical protein